MRYAMLSSDYMVENIIEADQEFAKDYLCVLIEGSDVCIGDTYDISSLWFLDSEGKVRIQNSELNAIDEDTVKAIRQIYSINDELKLHRLALLNLQNDEFNLYNDYVEQCRQKGNALKQEVLKAYYKKILLFELGADI